MKDKLGPVTEDGIFRKPLNIQKKFIDNAKKGKSKETCIKELVNAVEIEMIGEFVSHRPK